MDFICKVFLSETFELVGVQTAYVANLSKFQSYQIHFTDI